MGWWQQWGKWNLHYPHNRLTLKVLLLFSPVERLLIFTVQPSFRQQLESFMAPKHHKTHLKTHCWTWDESEDTSKKKKNSTSLLYTELYLADVPTPGNLSCGKLPNGVFLDYFHGNTQKSVCLKCVLTKMGTMRWIHRLTATCSSMRLVFEIWEKPELAWCNVRKLHGSPSSALLNYTKRRPRT